MQIYLNRYAHSSRIFSAIWFGPIDSSIHIRFTVPEMGQSHDYSSPSETTMNDMGKWVTRWKYL